ncbi:MAG: hypothetical protein ACP5QN_02660 [Minisyncoccia bacterium]
MFNFLSQKINWKNILRWVLIGVFILLIILLIFYAVVMVPAKYKELQSKWEWQKFCEENKDKIKEIEAKYPDLIKKYPLGCNF